MRMWNINPAILCRKHLIGEHGELHKMVGHINHGRRLGRYAEGLIARHQMRARHDDLAAEMLRRGYNHASPLPAFDEREEGWVHDTETNLRDLAGRCDDCKGNMA